MEKLILMIKFKQNNLYLIESFIYEANYKFINPGKNHRELIGTLYWDSNMLLVNPQLVYNPGSY